MTDATNIKHYTHYPMCGFCTNVWDMIYGRMRSTTSCERWLELCHWGGCDPDVWDYIDDKTGWPHDMKLGKNGFPLAYLDLKIKIVIPDYDNRIFHMRSNDSDNAPWRKTTDHLRAAHAKRQEALKNMDLNDMDFGEDEAVLAPDVDLDAPDLW